MPIYSNKDYACLSKQLLRCIRMKENENAKMFLRGIENSCNLMDTTGKTLLHYSVSYNNAVMVQYLIEIGCNVNAQDKFGVTSLFLAVKKKYETIVDVLLKNKADIYLTNYAGVSPLQFLARKSICVKPGDLKSADLNILESFFEIVNRDFSTDKPVLIRTLLNKNSAVKVALLVFGNEELAKYILDNYNVINYIPNPHGYTPLHWAINLKKFDTAKMLIDRGANVNIRSATGHMPLNYYAPKLQNVDQDLKLLISLLLASQKNSTMLSRKCTAMELQRLIMFANEETLIKLLQSEVNLPAIFELDTHCFYLLLTNLNSKAIVVLDELGIRFNVNVRDTNGVTALISAAYYGYVKHVEYLLDRGADVNLQTNNGCSALEAAILALDSDYSAERQHDAAKILHLLLHYGATFGGNFLRILKTIGDSLPTRVVIAHLALIGAIDKSKLINIEREDIMTSMEIKTHFNLCIKQLEEMKSVEIHGMTVTLFHFLSERDEKIVAYCRNPDLILGFNRVVQTMCHVEFYYLDTIEKRMVKASNRIELEKKAASIIEALTGLCSDVYYVIVHKIIDYLTLPDIANLYQVDNIIPTDE